jgi:hypothetical protein
MLSSPKFQFRGQRCTFTQVVGVILRKRARVQNPDKDEVARRLERSCMPGRSLRSLCVGGRDPSAVEVATPAPAVRLWPELAFQLRQAPDRGAVGAEVRLDLRGQLADGGQVDAEQLRAPLQRRRDRPAQVQVAPGPHRTSASNTVREWIGNAA